MTRLCLENLSLLPGSVLVPGYLTRTLPDVGIVHLGIGQFAKAHLAWYTDAVLQSGASDWRIVGASLRSNTAVQQLAAQNNLYTVTSTSAAGSTVQVVGALAGVLSVQYGDRDTLLKHLISPQTRIVSLTITEKGYYQNASGALDIEHPDIRSDLAKPDKPNTAIGWLFLGIKSRRDMGLSSFTPLSLDNLQGNGAVLKRMLIDYAGQLDVDLARYIEVEIFFPSSMVDRIVPAMSESSTEATQHRIGLADHACVNTESFSQWVVEDQFVSGRPPWEEAGVIFCEDVALFEMMKLRLLNGAHSSLAYLGALLGHETVADCLHDSMVSEFVEALMRTEIQPSVMPPPGFDLDEYVTQLLARFRNPGLHHQCLQIAMDGSQKIPQRLIPVLEIRLANDAPIHHLVFSLAVWMVFIQQHEPLMDPRASELKSLAQGADAAQLVTRLLATDIFPNSLGQSETLTLKLTAAVKSFLQQGSRVALAECLANARSSV